MGDQVVFVGSYPPRQCGIATFTYDLRQAFETVRQEGGRYGPSAVIAMGHGRRYAYPPEVVAEISRDDPQSYREAARRIRSQRARLVCLQHEYGLFGGSHGAHVLELLSRLGVPAVTTLHTILTRPPGPLGEITQRIARHSERVVVLAHAGLELSRQQGIPGEKLVYIPHGVPYIPGGQAAQRAAKQVLGISAHTVLATVGLLSRDKGIEYVLQALPELVRQHPELLYLIVGELHPEVRRREGQSYLDELMAMVRKLGLQEHVQFRSEYQTLESLCRYLQATDICVLPYLSRDQIVSGTLSYALAAGRAVVATPSLYAEECLAEGRGLLIPFRDADALATAISRLLDDPHLRQRCEERAWVYTRSWLWPEVVRRYIRLFREIRPRQRVWLGVVAGKSPAAG